MARPGAVVLASVRHTGTIFTRRLLAPWWEWCRVRGQTPSPSPLFSAHVEGDNVGALMKLAARHGNCVVPLRHPLDCAQSWIKRGTDLGLFLDSWDALVKRIDLLNPFYFVIGSDASLAGLSDYLDVPLESDWKPENHSDREVNQKELGRWLPAVERWCDHNADWLERVFRD